MEADLGRVQQDIVIKAQKIAAPIPANAVNIVVVDVCELVVWRMDVYDCMVVTGGPALGGRRMQRGNEKTATRAVFKGRIG